MYSSRSPSLRDGLGPYGPPSNKRSPCSRLFSTTVLGGSSSAPNLQDYARSHGKKFVSSFLYKDELLSMPAIKRFSVSFAKHPTNGFEGCSMVPSIYPLETLHNCLSLRQVSDFLTTLSAGSCPDSQPRPGTEGSSLFDVASSKGFMESLPPLASCFHEDQPGDRPPSEELLSMEEGGLQGFIPWGELLAVSEEEAVGPEQNRLEEAPAKREEQSKEGEGQPWGLWGPEPDPDGLNSKEV